MTAVIPFRRRKLYASSTEGRFTGRLGAQRVSFAQGVFFEILTDEGESWPCVIRSRLLRPTLADFKAGDPASVSGHLWMRTYDVGGATRDAHGVYAVEACPADFPWGQGLRLW